jgi:pyruvate-formate lyase-activating enzyme
MQATNLSISVPNYGCNKDCPYCVSKMTGSPSFYDIELMKRKLPTVLRLAERAGVTSISFTSKGEIFDSNYSNQHLLDFLAVIDGRIPCEVQTNGINLNKNFDMIDELAYSGIDVFAFSIDHPDELFHRNQAFNRIFELNRTIRLTINLVPSVYEKGFKWFVDFARDNGIHQLSFRTVTKPTNPVDTKPSNDAQKWIDSSINWGSVNIFLRQYYAYLQSNGMKIMRLPYGATLYMVEGVSCTHFDYCIQDSNNDNDIRSLIFHEDGHLSTSWYGSNYGRIL